MMINPIEDNRLVCDYTFAKRLLSLAESLEVNDACMFDEKESFISYATKLLKYQCLTVTEQSEIDYLKRVGVYDKYTQPIIITYCGENIYDLQDIELYSCIKNPNRGDSVMKHNARYFKEDRKPNPNRIFFKTLEQANVYLENNTPKYSVQDLINQGVYVDFFKPKF